MKFIVAIVFVLIVGTVVGKNSNLPKQGGGKKRAITMGQVSGNGHMVHFACGSKSQNETDQIRFIFTTEGFPRIRITYARSSSENDTEAKFSTRIGIMRLVEFNGTDTLNDSSNILQQISFVGKSNEWSQIAVNQETAENETFYKLVTTYSGEQNFQMKLTLRIAEDYLRLNASNVTLRPDGIKFDIDLLNLPFSADNGTKFALLFRAWAKGNVKPPVEDPQGATESEQLKVSIGDSDEGKFSWVHIAQKIVSETATDCPVVPSALLPSTSTSPLMNDSSDGATDSDRNAHESSHLVAFTFNCEHPNSVYWDPEIALSSDIGTITSFAIERALVQLQLLIVLSLLLFLF